MRFEDWVKFEAGRIASMGLNVPEDAQADYIRIQIEVALAKAFRHGRDGLTESDPPRVEG